MFVFDLIKRPQVLLKALTVAALAGGSNFAYALEVNVGTLLENFSQTVPQLMQLVTAFAYVMGMFMIYRGILELKKFGEQRTQMSSQHELKVPLILIAVGTALLYLPTSVQTGLTTFWSEPNPYAYQTDATDQWTTLINNCFMIIQLVGTIAFIRGLIILSHLAGHGQPGNFGKGMAHIIGGILCINIYEFVHAVINTLALGQI